MAHFCCEASKILYAVAIAEVEGLVRIDRQLAAHNRLCAGLNARSADVWEELSKIYVGIAEMDEEINNMGLALRSVQNAEEELASLRTKEAEVAPVRIELTRSPFYRSSSSSSSRKNDD